MRIAASARAGFTLLEVILAVTIALMLLGGLYVAMDTQLSQMDTGRELVENSTIGRAILNRISQDLTASPAPLQPVSTAAATTAASGTTAAASTTTTTATTSTTPPVSFQVGVKGDADRLSIFQARLTRSMVNPQIDPNGNATPPLGDVRRVTYFLAGSGGLAVQEILQATSDLVDGDLPTDVDDHTKILADEVKELKFRYYDGTTWQDAWDGSTPGPDGVTPQGPPQAVEISLSVKLSGVDQPKKYVHVVAFQTASGPPSQGATP